MNFFDKTEDSLYASMEDSTDGFYPISDEGIWHSGIHIYFEDPECPIKNPIEGKVVASCFDDSKDWNYIVTENEIQFPSDKKKEGYHCYNLISNLRAKMPFSGIVSKNNNWDESVPLNIENLKKAMSLPFYIRVKTKLPDTEPVDDRNFKVARMSINWKNIEDMESNHWTDNDNQFFRVLSNTCYISKGTKVMVNNVIIGFYNEDCIIHDYLEDGKEYNGVLSDISSRGKCIQLNENLPQGYFIIRNYEVEPDGSIKLPKENEIILWDEKEKGRKDYPGDGIIIKKDSQVIEKVLSLLEHKVEKETAPTIKSAYATARNMLEDFARSLSADDEYIYALSENGKFQVFPFVSEFHNKEVYKIATPSGRAVKPYYFPEEQFEFIKKELTGWWKGKILDFYYTAEELWRDNEFSYAIMEKKGILTQYSNFFDAVKILDKDGKEFSSDKNPFEKSKLESNLYAKAKLHLLEETEYHVNIDADDVYCERMFVRNPDIIGSFQSSEMTNGYPSSQMIEKKTGECAFSNLEEVLTAIEENKSCVWLRNGTECVYVPKKYYKDLKLLVTKTEVKKGDMIKAGDILGFPFWDAEPAPGEKLGSKPYIDYALFFTEDITEKTTTLETVSIQDGTDCLVEELDFEKSGGKIFLPPNCTLKTKPVSGSAEYVTLESFSYKACLYPKDVENKRLKDKATADLYLPSDKCKVALKDGSFCSVSPSIGEQEQKLVKDFVNEIVALMRDIQLNDEFSKDTPPKLIYSYDGEKKINAIIKKELSDRESMQFVDTYLQVKLCRESKMEEVYSGKFLSSDLEHADIDHKPYYGFFINKKMCYVSKDIVDGDKKNLLEDFNEKCTTVNLKKNPISTNKTCPGDKLAIAKNNINEYKRNLIDRLSESDPELVPYVMPADGSEDYNIYNEDRNFHVLLSKYLKRVISRHPMEWDFSKIKEDKVCESRGKAPVDEERCCDIAKDLKAADPKIFGKNSFYFACAPYFYNKMEELGLLEFNPYEGKTYENVYNPSWSMTESMKKLVIINNPGFAPYVGKSEHNINGYAVINWHFREKNKYYHEGVDFFGVRKGNTPVKALIFGKVVFLKDQGFYHYGKSILIKTYKQEDGKNIFYLLGHLDHYAEGIKEGATIQIGQVVGYVGNTGHCSSNVDLNGNGNGGDLYPKQRADGYGTHLHVTLYKTNKTELDFDFVPDLIKGTTSYPTTDRFDPFNHKRGYN